MKKLSELSNDTLLVVYLYNSAEGTVIYKEDFIQDYTDYQKHRVYIAEENIIKLDLEDISMVIEHIGQDAYEEWEEYVFDDIRDRPETKAFLNMVYEVSKKYPCYMEGKRVCIDI